MELPLYYTISIHAQFAGSLIIVLSCLVYFKERSHPIKLLLLYGVTSIAFSLLQSAVPIKYTGTWLNPIGNAYVLSEALILGLLYYSATKPKNFKKGIILVFGVYAFAYVYVLIFREAHSYSIIRAGRDLLLIAFALTYFFYLVLKLPEENLLRFPMFWINTGIIFFFSGTFILSFFRDYIVSVLKDNMVSFLAFRNFFRFAFCLVFAYGGWLDLKFLKQY